MTATPSTSIREIDLLAASVERLGIDADPMALLLLAHTARDLGVSEVIVNVMIDEDAPTVARIRAFARVSSTVVLTLNQAASAATERELQPAC